MTIPAEHCEAKKHGYRQTQDGVVVSFVLHPSEIPDGLALAALGTRYMLALVQIGDDEQPVEAPQKPASESKGLRAPKPFHTYSRSQQAGMACKDVKFQGWILPGALFQPGAIGTNIANADEAVKFKLRIKSKRELDSEKERDDAWLAWDALYAQFKADTGRTAVAR